MFMELTNIRHISHTEFHRTRLRNIENRAEVLFGFQIKTIAIEKAANKHTLSRQCCVQNRYRIL